MLLQVIIILRFIKFVYIFCDNFVEVTKIYMRMMMAENISKQM